jgi:hypothetical protein
VVIATAPPDLVPREDVAEGVRRGRLGPIALFMTLMAGYVAIGSVLILRYNIFEGDGISRVANAGFTVLSRDPHLSAIGFVWNPLPSVIQIPFVMLGRWWPELLTHGVAGVLQSAAFMAGAALLVRKIAIDHGVGTGWRWIAVACFALNPVIILYGSLGMSEAPEVFCLLWCTRYLTLWAASAKVSHLAWAGIALGVGYLVRYEVAPAACGVALFVAIVALCRSPRQDRMSSALLQVTIVVFPALMAFVVWALAGWIVSGELFATVSSQYGNSSQVEVAIAHGALDHNSNWLVIAGRLVAMQPFIGLAVILAIAIAVLKRQAAALVPIAAFGPVLLFAAWGQYSQTTFGWFRFYILAIPLVIVTALQCWTPAREAVRTWRLGSLPAKLGAALLIASLIIGIPITTMGMMDDDITDNNQVMIGIASLVDPARYPPEEQMYRRMGNDDRLLAAYLDRKNLPDGSVLADTFEIKVLWLASKRQKQFVITSDYNFLAALNRPWDHGVQYIVVTNPAHSAAQDAITRRYPTMWADGAGIGELVHSAVGAAGEARWRIYRVVEPTPTSPSP